jgi:nitrogenase subunit NifH
MSKLPYLTLPATTLAATLAALAAPAPALAQNSRISEIIVYGTDPCPRSTDDDVVVCARRPEAERFRIPEVMRESGTRQEQQSWTKQAEALMTAGATGIGSCSAVGPGATAGCAQQEIDRAFRERREEDAATVAPVR